MAGNGQAVIDLDKKRMQAMATKDVATLESLIADDLIYTHSSARLDTKRSLIDNMTSGSTVYTAVEPSDVLVTAAATLRELVAFIEREAAAGDPAQQAVLARGDVLIYERDIAHIERLDPREYALK